MQKRTQRFFWGALVLIMSLVPQLGMATDDYMPEKSVVAETNFLITVAEAAEIIGQGQAVAILEVSKSEAYDQWHIPGAVNIYRPEFSNPAYPYTGMLPTRQAMESLLGNLGVSTGDKILLYDDRDNNNTARVWWMLYHFGYDNMAIINGGKQAWERSGNEQSTTKTSPQKETFAFNASPRTEIYSSKEAVQAALEKGNVILLDTRMPEEYSGERLKDGATRPGHIPGAILMNYTDCLHFEGSTPVSFHSPEVLSQKFAALGITPDKEIIVYCHSGMRSSLTTFVLSQILHYPKVSNYDGSWVEWSYFPELPAETGAFVPPAAPVATTAPGESSPNGIANAESTPPAAATPSSETGGKKGRKYLEVIKKSYTNYYNYLIDEATFNYTYKPWWQNFLYWLLFISGFFFTLEIIKPWRKDQPRFRKDFWLDFFYMFFNVFLFGFIIFAAGENLLTTAFNDFLGLFGIENLVAVRIDELPVWLYFVILFFAADFIQWNVHRLLHRVPRLWEFHKVHHSVEQMGFAAHLRYHWMENVVYKSIQAIPLTMLGFNLVDLLVLHMFNIAWGHFNHSNITVNPRITGLVFGTLVGWGLATLYGTGWEMGLWIAGGAFTGGVILGPYMRYIFNSPEMHIWHHAKDMPESHPYGINFGLTLAIWDYIFGTAHVPKSGRDIELGFSDLEHFPKTFWRQLIFGFGQKKRSNP